MSNNTYRSLPTERVPDQYFPTTNALAKDTKGLPRTLTVVENTAVEEILVDSVWRIDAEDHQNEGAPAKIVRNLGTAGPILNCTSGSTSVADSNDPTFLNWNGTNYIYTTNTNGNRMTVPDEAALDITGDLEIIVSTAQDSWVGSGNQYFVLKGTSAAAQSYSLRITGSGLFLTFQWSADGTTINGASSTVGLSSLPSEFSAGQLKWIKVTFDVDNGLLGNDVKFYYSNDGVTYTQLGTTVTTLGIASIFAGTGELHIGQGGITGASAAQGKYFRAIVKNGINGTTVLDVDTSVITSGGATTFTAVTSQTVTILRSTTGRKSVAVTTPVWLFGTDDQMLVLGSSTGSRAVDFGPNDSFTVLAVIRQWATPTSNGTYLSKYDNAGFGYLIARQGTGANNRFIIETPNITNVATSVAAASGSFATVVGIRNTTTNTITSQTNTTAGTAVADTTNRNLTTVAPLSVGRRGTGLAGAATYQDFEFVAAAVFRRVLSASEILTLQTYYSGRWK
jgi:hypothetical protein